MFEPNIIKLEMNGKNSAITDDGDEVLLNYFEFFRKSKTNSSALTYTSIMSQFETIVKLLNTALQSYVDTNKMYKAESKKLSDKRHQRDTARADLFHLKNAQKNTAIPAVREELQNVINSLQSRVTNLEHEVDELTAVATKRWGHIVQDVTVRKLPVPVLECYYALRDSIVRPQDEVNIDVPTVLNTGVGANLFAQFLVDNGWELLRSEIPSLNNLGDEDSLMILSVADEPIHEPSRDIDGSWGVLL